VERRLPVAAKFKTQCIVLAPQTPRLQRQITVFATVTQRLPRVAKNVPRLNIRDVAVAQTVCEQQEQKGSGIHSELNLTTSSR
jgi:hypothetical protein